MTLTYAGTVARIHRQSHSFPTLIHVATEIGNLTFQAPHDCEDVTGRKVTLTVEIVPDAEASK